ncbi:sigma-54-dependent Fis family transcriptional regulator [Desulfosporosinus sp. BICA1-9]|uniref:sigma-54 interaction domain-containing protein n=1 Tax=Desulfosporosinus sp. BICA1-9 TaxID=1531958 RepID=UPI00054B3957|nr:sigma 54-interacting transcriptional regulator [Desulfosporosinus sp. BICA1-9]KJS50154.1 MAG: Fis family transcriptional regulator [Peptococcaceae bacterium BRH_c23]KJS80978.1 MAG: Fis family transcriptional regulator [Desulfosporosinus sp. BICA1-9]HBW37755.1 PAS domain-containing protein [Desulfosporosinus sp.]
MLKLLDLASQDFIVSPTSNNLWSLIDSITTQNKKFVITFNDKCVVGILTANSFLREILVAKETNGLDERTTIAELEYTLTFNVVTEDFPVAKLINFNTDVVVIINKESYPIGIINRIGIIKKMLVDYCGCPPDIQQTMQEYKKIFEDIEDEIFVTDQFGYVLRLNPAAERVIGVIAGDVVGRHVKELEKEGVFSTSITMHVLHQKKKINMIQLLKSGKTVISTAFPIFDEEGEIARVVSTSKDYQEITKLKSELEKKETELERKNQEINTLREEIFSNVNLIYNSKEMAKVRDTVYKIAPIDLTVLIQGESGVGKEVITKAIHYASLRSDQPFIKINCSVIPETLIESELFGYESGAFTGATKGGKIGKIELANNGTLFLDEIGELPLLIQVKLLEFLQDREICKVGGTNKIKIDTRIITATNRNLQNMVNEGLFRKDLFYRLNVVPINIPPLRERKEDIPALVKYFLEIFNSRYGMNKTIAPEVMQALYTYSWPGNVRELEHVLERAVIISDMEVITLAAMQNFLELKTNNKKVTCTEIMPLKLAKRELEEQLVKNAYDIYKSTYKAAKALEINQSTVVKILKKYRLN